MMMTDVTAILAAGIGAALGLFGIFAPDKALKIIGLKLDPEAKHGVSELRATYGGLFIGGHLAALAFLHPIGFAVLGAGWGVCALGRVGSILADKAGSGRNWMYVAWEAGLALALLGPLIIQIVRGV